MSNAKAQFATIKQWLIYTRSPLGARLISFDELRMHCKDAECKKSQRVPGHFVTVAPINSNTVIQSGSDAFGSWLPSGRPHETRRGLGNENCGRLLVNSFSISMRPTLPVAITAGSLL